MHWTDGTAASIFVVKAQPGEVIVMQAVNRLPWIVPVLLACAAGGARADVVTDWNVVALNASAVPPNSIVQSRTLAIAHAAVYDAVRAVEGTGPAYAVDAQARRDASVEAAVAAAAHAALERLAPAAKPMLDAALSATLAKVPDGKAKTDGVSLGKQVGELTVALRVGDGADAKVAFNPKPGVGAYVLTPPQALPAILPQWGAVTPFVLRGNVALEWKGPPAPGSAAFARDYDEVKSVGARQSSTRSADQTAAAVFWTVQTAVPWHAAARAVSAAKGLSVSDNAKLFAMLSMATADSQIVAFAEKYRHPHWRPITAIRAGLSADGGNTLLERDAKWEPLIGTPPHPEYPSAHAAFSGAAEVVLRAWLGGDDVEVSVTSPPLFGLTRTYRRLSQISEEVENARVWGGIHFRSAVRDGTEVGRTIGATVVRDFPARGSL
jgi:hypothetical protein